MKKSLQNAAIKSDEDFCTFARRNNSIKKVLMRRVNKFIQCVRCRMSSSVTLDSTDSSLSNEESQY